MKLIPVKLAEKKSLQRTRSNTGLVLVCLLVLDVILIRTGASTLTDMVKMMKALALSVVVPMFIGTGSVLDYLFKHIMCEPFKAFVLCVR